MKTKEDFFEFSKKQQKFFDAFYAKKGWPCKRIHGKENRRFDCVVNIGGKIWKFEEKSRSRDYDDLLVEIIQDVDTQDPGRLYYCEADYLLYKMPNNFYAINFKKLQAFVKTHGQDYDFKTSEKGWGKTLNIAIPWKILLKEKIATKIKK